MFWQIQGKLTIRNSKVAEITKREMSTIFFFKWLTFLLGGLQLDARCDIFFLQGILWILLLGKGEDDDALT